MSSDWLSEDKLISYKNQVGDSDDYPLKTKIRLSKRKHVPVLILGSRTYPIWQLKRVRTVEKTGLELDSWAQDIIFELPEFKKYYLPPFSLKGKTVLDIGACCGETAWFYLKQGAQKVICIEPDPTRVKMIEINKKNLNMNVEIIADCFRPEHLSLEHNFVKCDIEGYETLLLPYAKSLKPCILEAHTWLIREQFEKEGFHVVCTPQKNAIVCLMANY